PAAVSGVFCTGRLGPLWLWVTPSRGGKRERSEAPAEEVDSRPVVGAEAGYRICAWAGGGRVSPGAQGGAAVPRVPPIGAAPERLAEADVEQLLGLTVGEAAGWLGVDLAGCTVFDEPPMLARGVIGHRPGGEGVWLWVAYRAGIFRERPDWAPE